MKIPKIIHQTWKTKKIPLKWRKYQKKVKKLHPDWEYRFWTDEEIDSFVKSNFPDFYDIFNKFSRHIMRIDVIRYLIMYKLGGLYLDLDYEMLKPFDFKDASLVLPMNRSRNAGDPFNCIGNCIFASVPEHKFWQHVIDDLKNNPPHVDYFTQIGAATGPVFLTRIYYHNTYKDIITPDRIFFHPRPPKNKAEYQAILDKGISYGIHHGWGSWKERFNWRYIKIKAKKLFKRMGLIIHFLSYFMMFLLFMELYFGFGK